MGLRRRQEPDPPVVGFPMPPGPAGVPPGQAPYQQSQYPQSPYQQPPYQQPPYQQSPYQQSQYPQSPYQQPPYQQSPYQQAPYQQPPYQQPSYEQAPYQQAPYEQSQYQQAPYQQAPYQQAPYQQAGPGWPGAAAPPPAAPAPAARSGGTLPFVVMGVVLALAVGIVAVAYQRTRTASFDTPATVAGMPLYRGQHSGAIAALRATFPADEGRWIFELYGTDATFSQNRGYMLAANDRPSNVEAALDAMRRGSDGTLQPGAPQQFPGGVECRVIRTPTEPGSVCTWRSRHTAGLVLQLGSGDVAALARVTVQVRKDVEG